MGLRIHVLPDEVANQIAAGEVVERPASVVKELLENSLDAQATAIHIDIGFGGLNQITISDNGLGIHEYDLPLAIQAHATSKISQLNDLYAISSMGFRGEALASIASVSRLTLSSKTQDQAHAMMLQTHGHRVDLKPCARTQGTTVDVRDLFYNAPVRKMFLKSAQQEYQAIEMLVKRFAMSAPTLSLQLKHNDRLILNLEAAVCDRTVSERIKKLLGKRFYEHAIYLDVERAGMRLRGWVSNAEYQRSQNDQQWIYVNQRMVKDKLLSHALKQAYEQVLYPGRYPACLLYLSLPSSEVDINVHPTKHEVRFQHARLVHDLFSSQIKTCLSPVSVQTDRLDLNERHHEPDIKSSLRTPKEASVHASRWWVVNPHFVLAFIHQEPYLVDIVSVQKDYLKTRLLQEPRPLMSRPLLVPVRWSMERKHFPLIEAKQTALLESGLEFDFLSQTSIIVRRIPCALPLLDVSLLFTKLVKMDTNSAVSLETLVDACSFDGRHCSDEEQAQLIHYLEDYPDKIVRYCKPLTIERCRNVVYD